MDKNHIDDLFNNKLHQIKKLPDHIEWNSTKGWGDYQKQYITRTNKLRRTFIYISSLAAIFTVFFFVFYHINNSNPIVKVYNKTHKVKEIFLPDGSKLWLNRNSSVQYYQKTKNYRQELTVDGEVYMELDTKEDEEYIIKASNTIIWAETSTQLNISAYPKDVNVDITVSSGAVKISEIGTKNGLSLLLTEGHYCSVHKTHNIIFASEINNNNYLAWKTGQLTFEDNSLESVVEILAKYYHKDIKLENKSIAYCNYTGTFKKQPLDTVLNRIQSSLKLDIKMSHNIITLVGKGCL